MRRQHLCAVGGSEQSALDVALDVRDTCDLTTRHRLKHGTHHALSVFGEAARHLVCIQLQLI